MSHDQALAQKLAQEKIHTIIFDVDGTLFPPFIGYAIRFSIETARAAILIAEKRRNDGTIDVGLLARIDKAKEDNSLDKLILDLTNEAAQSYADYGLTTEIFAVKYGFNREELYKAHHYLIARDLIIPEFAKYTYPKLQAGMAALSQTDLRLIAFTDGTEFHAREVTRVLGLDEIFNGISGIDTHRKRHYALKSQKAAWVDLLAHYQIPSDTGYVIGQTGRMMNYKDSQWNGILFIDDSPEKLKAAHHFGIRTALMQTDRVNIDVEATPYIDHEISDLGIFTDALAKAKGFTAEPLKTKRCPPVLRLVTG